MWLEENGVRQEVEMTMEEVLRAIKWLVKERERIRLKSTRLRRARGIQERKFRPKPDPDAPAPEKRPRGRPRKNPVPEIRVEIPPAEQTEPAPLEPSEDQVPPTDHMELPADLVPSAEPQV